jgi:hypothetical protein
LTFYRGAAKVMAEDLRETPAASAAQTRSRHSYWRQLRDITGSLPVEEAVPAGLTR